MPLATVFNQEMILEEAFRIIRTEGIKGLTARRIAHNLGCSTQPVYSAFGSMQKLQDIVLQKAKVHVVEYLLQNPQGEDPFFAMGMQYFRFSREEKVLFKLLFLEGEMALTLDEIREMSAPLVERIKLDDSLMNLKEDQLKRLGRDMWIYVHGLVSFMRDNDDPDDEVFVREQLLHMGKTVIEWELWQVEK